MGMTAEEILAHVRALSPRERLELVERVVHEVVAEQAGATSDATLEVEPWVDVTDEEHDAFLAAVRDARRTQPLRSAG